MRDVVSRVKVITQGYVCICGGSGSVCIACCWGGIRCGVLDSPVPTAVCRVPCTWVVLMESIFPGEILEECVVEAWVFHTFALLEVWLLTTGEFICLEGSMSFFRYLLKWWRCCPLRWCCVVSYVCLCPWNGYILYISSIWIGLVTLICLCTDIELSLSEWLWQHLCSACLSLLL